MGDIQMVVSRMPEYPEECPFSYDKTEFMTPAWAPNGYLISVDYCSFARSRCELSDGKCRYLTTVMDILEEIEANKRREKEGRDYR